MQKNRWSRTFRSLRALAWVTALGMLSACKSYHLGSPAEVSFESIYIAPVSNHSYAPQAQTIISATLREYFLRDTRVKMVASKENADVVLLVDLTDYQRDDIARNQQDTAIADSFDINLVANFSLLNQKNGTYELRNRSVQATTNIYARNPYVDDSAITYQLNERQAMEQLARELARKISNEILNPW